MQEIQIIQKMIEGQEYQLEWLRTKLKKKAIKLLAMPAGITTAHNKAIYDQIISELWIRLNLYSSPWT